MKVGTDFIGQDKYCCQINYLASMNQPASAICTQLCVFKLYFMQ